jgi:hypothetical protein
MLFVVPSELCHICEGVIYRTPSQIASNVDSVKAADSSRTTSHLGRKSVRFYARYKSVMQPWAGMRKARAAME